VEIDNGLLKKYRALLAENSALREENERLKASLGITDPSRPNPSRYPENYSAASRREHPSWLV
jgi:regulator of replication initiation timing